MPQMNDEVKRVVRMFNPPIAMPREVAIAFAVLIQMVKYSGTLENREKVRAELRELCAREYDRRHPPVESIEYSNADQDEL